MVLQSQHSVRCDSHLPSRSRTGAIAITVVVIGLRVAVTDDVIQLVAAVGLGHRARQVLDADPRVMAVADGLSPQVVPVPLV